MFSQSQRFYDAIYSEKDYAEEARRLKRFILVLGWTSAPSVPSV